jgi:hypothetical protein
MSEKLKLIAAHGIPPTWRLVWWNFQGHRGWMRPKGSRLKKFVQPQPQVVEFYSEALARRHIEELRREHGSDNIVVKLSRVRDDLGT